MCRKVFWGTFFTPLFLQRYFGFMIYGFVSLSIRSQYFSVGK